MSIHLCCHLNILFNNECRLNTTLYSEQNTVVRRGHAVTAVTAAATAATAAKTVAFFAQTGLLTAVAPTISVPSMLHFQQQSIHS